MSQPLRLKFSEFYRGKPPGQSCFGNLDVGREYKCPKTGKKAKIVEQELNPWFASRATGRKTNCHGARGLLGQNPACHRPKKMEYTADGRFVRNSCKRCQSGGGTSDGYPRDTCGCRVSSQCGYVKFNSLRQYGNLSAEVPGVYFDLTKPHVGNRPVIGEYDNNLKIPNTLLKGTVQNLDRQFDCQQPFWCKPCM